MGAERRVTRDRMGAERREMRDRMGTERREIGSHHVHCSIPSQGSLYCPVRCNCCTGSHSTSQVR